MTAYSTIVRATHVLTNAAWFGGSLAGAVALNPAARQGDEARERAEVADEGWRRWGPMQGSAIGLHLLSGLAILADNRRRVLEHRPTTAAVILKTALTAGAILVSAEAYRSGAELVEAAERAHADSSSRGRARALTQRMSRLQWATPATTGCLLVLDAFLGEQQRGAAGLLDPPTRLKRRS
ncbi:MAG: hypothetical protein ACKOVB_16540 [Terrabacter sp.]